MINILYLCRCLFGSQEEFEDWLSIDQDKFGATKEQYNIVVDNYDANVGIERNIKNIKKLSDLKRIQIGKILCYEYNLYYSSCDPEYIRVNSNKQYHKKHKKMVELKKKEIEIDFKKLEDKFNNNKLSARQLNEYLADLKPSELAIFQAFANYSQNKEFQDISLKYKFDYNPWKGKRKK